MFSKHGTVGAVSLGLSISPFSPVARFWVGSSSRWGRVGTVGMFCTGHGNHGMVSTRTSPHPYFHRIVFTEAGHCDTPQHLDGIRPSRHLHGRVGAGTHRDVIDGSPTN